MEKLKKTMEKLKRHETQKKIQNCKKKKYQKQFCTHKYVPGLQQLVTGFL